MAWLTRLANLLRRRDLNSEIDEEFAFHIDARTEANIANGMTEDEARRDARQRFGSRAGLREETRDANVLVQLESLWQDLRHGTRMLVRNPALATIAVMSIAFGTGANVAIFSMADALLLQPLPVAEPGRLLAVGFRVLLGTTYQSAASYSDYRDIRDRTQSFEGVLAYDYETVAVTARAGGPPRIRFATFVSDNFFDVLGVGLSRGRGFRSDEGNIADPRPVVVLSDSMWRSEFGAAPSIMGQTLRISGIDCQIIGVSAPTFTGVHSIIKDSLYLPLAMLPRVGAIASRDVLEARDARILRLKGRLRPGVSLSQAQAELTSIQRDLERAYPETNTNVSLLAQTEFDYRFEQRPLDSSMIVVLTILSTAVLAVACANVAGLLGSRAPIRAREIAVRLAIGASRARLVRQLVTESAAIAVVGGVGGLAVAQVGIRLLRQIRFPSDAITPPSFQLGERALLFSLSVEMLSAILVGLGPAWQTTRVDLCGTIKSSDRGNSARRRLTGRSALVALQIALSLVVLTIAVFAVQTFRSELTKGPGFRTTHMAKVTVSPGQAGYSDASTVRFYARVLDEMRSLSGVQSAAVTSSMPLFAFRFVSLLPEGRRLDRGETVVPVWANSVDEGYFDTMDIGMIAGRPFAPSDDASAPAVAIVNDTLARHYWPGSDPIGKRLQILEPDGPLVEVVGVVRTTTYLFPGERPQQAIHFPYRQRPSGSMVLLARVTGASADHVRALGDTVHGVDADVPVYDAQTIEDFYSARVTAIGSVLVRLVGWMALMGLILTMVGLYGLVSYSVSRRVREIGIRIAVGATPARIVMMVLREGMLPAWVGLTVGLAASAATGRVITYVLPITHHVGARTYALVVPMVFVVNAIAALIPARRAATVDPTNALRCE
ncbi:MAG TPA: ABC transporter permease [Vicinamibacterales bacterium]|nr:ABC transporter permease [Vicinamibacterales bacterium]